MNNVNAIDDIWLTYQVMMDAIKVTARGIGRGKIDLLRGTYFVDSVTDTVKHNFETCRNAASDHAILSMWAVFERRVITALTEESRKMLDKPTSGLNSSLYGKVVDAIEYWRVNDLLDIIKPLVGGDIVGQAKQIKSYRDWVAHKNPRKPSPAKVTPQLTHQVLTAIMQQLVAMHGER